MADISNEKRAYLALLQIPLTSRMRHTVASQARMAELRDFIATQESRGSEWVQNEYEIMAATLSR